MRPAKCILSMARRASWSVSSLVILAVWRQSSSQKMAKRSPQPARMASSASLALWKFSDGSNGIMNNLIGITIDHYQILVKIRETPTRILFKAYNTRSQNQVAFEVVKVSGPQPDELLGLINEQMRKNALLTHPNIATIIDAGLHEGLIYIVYSFSPTRPLHRFFNRTYSWQETSRELVSVTNAMAYAHEKGVTHGYLHPASVVLDERRNPILFDF